MKLKFKTQAYQSAAVQAVVDCFRGQPPANEAAMRYTLDPGRTAQPVQRRLDEDGNAFRNADLVLNPPALLANIQQVQRQQNLPMSAALVSSHVAPVNLDIEMETGTHKTQHNRVHRLDALDAYNQKLVKKIAVRGITVKGLAGTNA